VAVTLSEFHERRRQEEGSWDRGALRKQAGQAFVDELEQLLPKERHQFAPDQFAHIERTPLFDACKQICERYQSGTAGQREWLRSRVDRLIGGNLAVFGLRAAVLAAREHSPELARTSLIAFAIVDLAGKDVRDVLIGISLLCHCARLSGAEMPGLFREVAAIAGPALSAVYNNWAERYPDVQRIGVMGWREVETEQGIGFRNQ
jgi:hypothetical protein